LPFNCREWRWIVAQRFFQSLDLAHRFAKLICLVLGPYRSPARVVPIGKIVDGFHQLIEHCRELPLLKPFPGSHLTFPLPDATEQRALLDLRCAERVVSCSLKALAHKQAGRARNQ